MNGCQTCGGFGGHHDPIAHDWEPARVVSACPHADEHPLMLSCGSCDYLSRTAQELVANERRRIVTELRDFADDLYGITGARWIADVLTNTLDRISEGTEAPPVVQCNGMCVMGNEVMPGQPAHQGHNDDPRGGYYDWAAYPHPECPRHGEAS